MDFELTLNSGAPSATASAAVREYAVAYGLSPQKAIRLQALVEQMVLESRQRECVASADELKIRAMHADGKLQIEVLDYRLPINQGDVHHSEARRLIALGFADEIHTKTIGNTGNSSICSVSLDEHGSEFLTGSEVLSENAPTVSDDDVAQLVIRKMVASDAINLARCVYRCYGYSYPNSMLYQPKLVAHALHQGLMHSAVAVRSDGEVVGHCALSFSHNGSVIPEVGKLVVDPRYRGHHIADKLALYSKADAKELGLNGYWAACIATHPYSQYDMIASGGGEIGLFINGQPGAVQMEGIQSQAKGRHSLVPFFIPINKDEKLSIYLPERHIPFFTKLMQTMGLKREISSLPEKTNASSIFSIALAKEHTPAHLYVTKIGDDLMDRVARELPAILAFNPPVVYLDLPLDSPGAIEQIEALESLGFLLAAWLPNFNPISDTLRLQKINDSLVDEKNILCARSEGEFVRDHILAEWRRVQKLPH